NLPAGLWLEGVVDHTDIKFGGCPRIEIGVRPRRNERDAGRTAARMSEQLDRCWAHISDTYDEQRETISGQALACEEFHTWKTAIDRLGGLRQPIAVRHFATRYDLHEFEQLFLIGGGLFPTLRSRRRDGNMGVLGMTRPGQLN